MAGASWRRPATRRVTAGNPLTDAEVELKFRGLASAALSAAACDRALAEVWGLDRAPSLDGLFAALSTDVPVRQASGSAARGA